MKDKNLFSIVLFLAILFVFQISYIKVPNLEATNVMIKPNSKDYIPHHPVGTTVFGGLNYSQTTQTHAVDLPSPGIYNVNFSFTCEQSLSTFLYYFVSVEGSHYAPAFDNYFNDSKTTGMRFWICNTGYSSFTQSSVVAVCAGLIFIQVISSIYAALDAFSYNFTVTEEVLASSATTLNLDVDNEIEWTHEFTWKWLHLPISQKGLYNITATLTLPYNTPGSWSGYPIETFSLRDYNSTLGYQYFTFYTSIPAGSGTYSMTFSRLTALTSQNYFLPVRSLSFLHLGGGSVNLTFQITQIPTKTVSTGSPAKLEFSTTDMFDYVLLEFSPDTEYTVKFEAPEGINWTINGYDLQSLLPAYLSYASGENSSTPYYTEMRWIKTVQLLSTVPPADSISGRFDIRYWTIFRQVLSIYNGTVMGVYSFPMAMWSFTGLVPIMFGALPSTGASLTFNITLTMQESPISSIGPGESQQFEFDTTTGPAGEYFIVDVQGGNLYEVTVEPTDYTISGHYILWLFPPTDYENWFFPELITPGVSMYPGLFWENTTKTVRFVPTTDGSLTCLVSSYFGDLTKAMVSVKKIAPSDYILGTLQSVNIDEFLVYRFDIKQNHYYHFNIDIKSPTSFVRATVFDDQGNTPFTITEQELWMQADSFFIGKSFTGSFYAKQTGEVTLVLTTIPRSGLSGPITLQVIEVNPIEQGHILGSLTGLIIALAWGIPAGILLAVLVLWLKRRYLTGERGGVK